MELLEAVKTLSLENGASGSERAVRDRILSMLPANATARVDALGNLIVFVKGEKTPKNRVMLAAHMDEVGFMVTSVEKNGLLRFACVGGVSPAVICGKRAVFENGTVGVFGLVPVHQLSGEKKRAYPDADEMYIDIGASSYEEAYALVKPGDTAVFLSDFTTFGAHAVKGKALDDRAGCAILLDLINRRNEYDLYCAFNVQEEVGCRGAGASTTAIAPDYAIVVETTTAADLPDTDAARQVCALGKGPAVSFMDRSTVYNPALYRLALDTAKQAGVPVQPKAYVAGGNDAGVIHKTGAGVRTLAVSLPCRYLHSAACILDRRDIEAGAAFVGAMAAVLCDA